MIEELKEMGLMVSVFISLALGLLIGSLGTHLLYGLVGRVFYKVFGEIEQKVGLNPNDYMNAGRLYDIKEEFKPHSLQEFAIVEFVNKRWGALYIRDMSRYVEVSDERRLSCKTPNEVRNYLRMMTDISELPKFDK